MGLYDTVQCHRDEFQCSEGHDLSDEDFQTKDLGCTMGSWVISERISGKGGGYGLPLSQPISGILEVYCSCRKCPAFVQAGTGNLVSCSVEFAVKLRRNKVISVTRQGMTTAEWIKDELAQPYMKGCAGPMPWEEAMQKHTDHYIKKR